MASNNTFERVCEIVRDRGGIEDVELTLDTKLADAGLDSLTVVEVVMGCEDEFGIEIDPEVTPATIGEFVEVVDSLL